MPWGNYHKHLAGKPEENYLFFMDCGTCPYAILYLCVSVSCILAMFHRQFFDTY